MDLLDARMIDQARLDVQFPGEPMHGGEFLELSVRPEKYLSQQYLATGLEEPGE